MCYVAVEQFAVVAGHNYCSPGELTSLVHYGYVVGTFCRHDVQPAKSAYLRLRGVGWECCHQSVVVVLVTHEVHAGIVFHASIHYYRLLAVGQTHCQRTDGERVLVHLRESHLVVVRLEGVAPSLTSTVVVHVWHKCLVVGFEVEETVLLLHLEVLFFRLKTICCCVVIGSEHHVVVVTSEGQLVVRSFSHSFGRSRGVGLLHLHSQSHVAGISLHP